ncbi:MAG: TRAP transporter substrate-binding protein DctP [Hyphomicrobium aestuarii]|nr:TRAP transporter substrate-binding protein DctP [Hyphomicrobium aestuarii]
MNRRKVLQATVAGVAATAAVTGSVRPSATLAAPAIADVLPVFKWRMTSSFPKSLDTIYGAGDVFAKTVAEITDNRFQIQVFAPGEIVPGLQALDAVSNATVECCHTASYYYWGKDPTFAFGTAVPFGLNCRMQNAWMYDGGGIDLLNDFYKRYGVLGLPAGNTGAQMGGWYRKEIKSVDDFRGLKMRIGGFGGAVLARLGAQPVQLPGAEVYGALEKGALDAAEWVGPYDDEKLRFQDVAKYYYYPGWWEGQAMLHFFINLEQWTPLPKPYQAAIKAAACHANTVMTARYDMLNAGALRRLVKSGAELRTFPVEALEACFAATTAVFDETSAKNADFKRVYQRMKEIRADNYMWFQVAEATNDTFMMLQSRKAGL